MPLKHLRICDTCDRVRFAPCGKACRVPNDIDPDSWRINLQDGAGTIGGEGWADRISDGLAGEYPK
ncbi:hypothetical protein PBI_SQUIRTY_96 [Mycobacterium phage Squirty]|uniref:Uncharacterized protein n=2 Tax=Gracegardnervirinae TaxID=2946632 RepID=A0A386KQG2_9CAUD|nr:hypothetical protein PBI_SQUIRTY_96 [Mycobacterium phage Squirty]YP_009954575.1 hypothetical protein I5H13_gp096 [Mycobacterium phage ArcusAngelus]AIM41043.1 hypothetical protein PBI_SQUIRTY_96 [Mycobacterium phage Squirty]AYD87845.1 hypothetical protein SEA_ARCUSANGELUS_97 [Mycobacterium phage ArcusAngelus]WDW20062.1 hypothetical protein [Mycobacterium phage LOCARD]